MKQLLASLVFVLVGLVLVAYAVVVLGNLFADHPDSPSSTYLLVGLPPLIVGMAIVAIGLFGMRNGIDDVRHR